MNVINVCAIIRLVADKVFPISALPDSTLSPANAHLRAFFSFWQLFGKTRLDQTPPRRKVRVAIRKLNNAMQMIREYHPSVNFERMSLPYQFNGRTQAVDAFREQGVTVPLQQINSEEIGSAWMPGAAIVRHGGSIPAASIRRCQSKSAHIPKHHLGHKVQR